MMFQSIAGAEGGACDTGVPVQELANLHPLDEAVDHDRAVEMYGLDERQVGRGRLQIEEGRVVVLDATAAPALPWTRLTTAHLDRFKHWIGLPDRYIRSGRATPVTPSPGEWSPILEDLTVPLEDDERRDLALAADGYLFGDSRRMRRYARAIEMRLAPFEAVVYAVESLEIRPGARLEIRGCPTVLLARELVVHGGGCVHFFTACRVLVDRMVKVELA